MIRILENILVKNPTTSEKNDILLKNKDDE